MLSEYIQALRERLRAERVGSPFNANVTGRPVWIYHDPETGKVWMATHRLSWYRVEIPEHVDLLRDRLTFDPRATLWLGGDVDG